jgi:hypothetical protein
MSNGTRATLRDNSRLPKEPRTILSAALKHSLLVTGTSVPAAARFMGRRSTKTVKRWLRGSTPIVVEAVMKSRRLWPHFLRCLVGIERKARRV